MSRHFGGIQPGRQADKTKTVLLVSLFFVVIFTVLAFVLLSTGQAKVDPKPVVVETEAEVKMVDVLVPVQEIAAGTELEPRMFRKESRPQVGVSQRIVKDFEEIQNYYARSLIVSGQPLHKDYITSVRPVNAVTANIPPGFRAVTIRVDARTSVEGFVRPGAKVDVVWASRIRGQPGVTTIVENAKVLSAERQTQQEIDAAKKGVPVPSTVTLLVGIADAQKIQLASTTGTLSLSLRGDSDGGKGVGEGKSITIDDLLGAKRKDEGPEVEGTVTIGGEKWNMVDGKLVPIKKSRSSE